MAEIKYLRPVLKVSDEEFFEALIPVKGVSDKEAFEICWMHYIEGTPISDIINLMGIDKNRVIHVIHKFRRFPEYFKYRLEQFIEQESKNIEKSKG